MYCDRCGKEVRAEALYCWACGNSLSGSVARTEEAPPPIRSPRSAGLPVERLIAGIERVINPPLRRAITAFLRWVGLGESRVAKEAAEVALIIILLWCVGQVVLLGFGLLLMAVLVVFMVGDALIK